ncbi:unnamed protein product [Closterium sp. NIES-54]
MNRKKLRQIDVTNAFLYAPVDAEIFVELPHGSNAGPNQICQLEKSLYGIKQAPRLWQQHLHTRLTRIGFLQLPHNQGMYPLAKGTDYILLIVYVDDLLYIGSTDTVTTWFEGELQGDLTLTVATTVTQYLGLNIEDGDNAIYLSAAKYTDTIAKRFAITPTAISMPYCYINGNWKTSALLKPAGVRDYQRKLDCLLFAAVTCRPDLSYSANQLATYLKKPEADHMLELDRALHYLPSSPLPGPSTYFGPTRRLTERREPESRLVSSVSRAASPLRTARAGRVLRPRPPPVPGTHSMTLRPSTAPQLVPLPSPPASSLPDGPDPESDSLRATSPTLVDFAAACRLDYVTCLVAESTSASVCPPSVGGECALGTDVLEDRQEEFECFAAAVPHLVSMLLAPEGDSDAPDIPTPRSYAEVIEGPYSSEWQVAMDAEMASWKSTGTYVDEVPPPGANIVSGMWMFRVKRPPGSPPVFKARYVARGFSERQGVDFVQTFSPIPKMTTLWVPLHVAAHRDYELQSLDFSAAFLQGSLHEEIWLHRPPGFTGSFPASTQWSLRRPVYGLRQAPPEWHDTLRSTLAALGFAPSTADTSLFLRTDTTLPPFYILVYVDDLVFAIADTEALAHVKFKLQKRHTCTDLGELTSYLGLWITRDRAQRTITLTRSHMVQQVLQRFGFTYSSPQSTPLPTGHSLSAPPSDESVVPSGPYPELVGCLISSCEAEIYAGAMAAQELRWLTYLLTDLGEAPRSPPFLFFSAQQISRAWKAVPADLIKRAFLTCGISNALDGSEDGLAMAHRRSQLTAEVDVDGSIIADGFIGNNCQELESDEEE